MGDLGNAMQNLVDDINSSTEIRYAGEAVRREAAQQYMSDLGANVKAGREATQQFMGGVRADVEAGKEATRQMIDDARVKISEIRSDTHNLLERYHLEDSDRTSDEAVRKQAHAQFMSNLRGEVEANKGATQQLIKNVRADIDGIKSDTHDMLDEFASNRREMEAVWRGRFGATIGKVVPEPVVEEEPAEEVAPEPVVEEAGPSADDRVLEVIAKHPDGIRLVDIGNELGVDWRGLIATVKPLVDEDRVEKIDNLYYPKN